MAATDLNNTNWKLTSYAEGASLLTIPADVEVTLTFQDGRAGGRSACNRYSSAVTVGDDTLTFSMAVSTKMACPPPLMEIEGKYLRTLESVTGWQLANGQLELRDSAGQTLLVFERA